MRRGLKVFDTLNASDLCSKFGFGEGESFPNMKVSDKDYMDAMQGASSAEVLFILVKKHLLPEIERVTGLLPKIYLIDAFRNPVRAEDYERDTMPPEWESIEVTVLLDDLRAAAKEVREKP